ncbi:unnamed protein product, partial [Cuscuta europaea]
MKYIVCSRAGFKNNACPPVSDTNVAGSEGCPTNRKRVSNRTDTNVAGSEGCPSNRKRVSNRIGCKAMLTLKYSGFKGYSVFAFEQRHNHSMCSELSKQFLKVNRNLDLGHQKFVLNCFRANIGTMKSYRLYKEIVGGYSNIGATSVDFKNFKRDLMAYIAGVDAQIVIDKLFRKQEVSSAFFFDYDVNDSDQLTRLFWADPICRKNYALFGDVVSFDATYGTNRYNMVFGPFTEVDNHRKCVTFGAGLLLKEDVESYVWLFTCFINVMGRQPTCIITYQDPAMRIAIEKVFTSSKHRYCMWHIMSKVTQKVGPVLSKNETFMSSLNSIVWSHYLEPSQFEEKWISLMNEYELTKHDWFVHMFELRYWWIPSYFRDLFMAGLLRTTSRSESENSFFREFTNPHFSLIEFLMQFESAMDAQRHAQDKLNSGSESYLPVLKTPLSMEKAASDVFTLAVFYDIQSELCSACFSCRVLHVHGVDGDFEYEISDDRNLVFRVDLSMPNMKAVCSCKYYERIGMVCRHIFFVLKDLKLERILNHLVNSRWCKKGLVKPLTEISDSVLEQTSLLEDNKMSVNTLWSDIYACMALVENNPDYLKQFSGLIKQQKQILLSLHEGVGQCSTKNSLIESFYGSGVPSEVTVHPPQQA